MTENFDDLIKYRITRAFETLKEAETMLDNDFFNASVNRVYYACYYAVIALLLTKAITASSHKGTRQMFGFHFVNSGIISKDQAKFFTDLYDRRQSGDYDDFIVFDKKTSETLLLLGKEFVAEIDRILKTKF